MGQKCLIPPLEQLDAFKKLIIVLKRTLRILYTYWLTKMSKFLMKSHFTVIAGLRDLYLNWDVLLQITSYRDSYVIGAIDTSVNRCFEYHGPHGLRQS